MFRWLTKPKTASKCDTLEVEYIKQEGHALTEPCVEIVLRNGDRETQPLIALIDSGANFTVVPRKCLEILRPVQPAKPVICDDFTGRTVRQYPLYVDVLLQKDGEQWQAVRPSRGVIFTERRTALIGRDVLDSFTVILNGETAILIPKKEK